MLRISFFDGKFYMAFLSVKLSTEDEFNKVSTSCISILLIKKFRELKLSLYTVILLIISLNEDNTENYHNILKQT